MSKTVTFTADVYPYCVGDVIVLNDEELKAVNKVAKTRNEKVYTEGAQESVSSTDEADKNEASLAAQGVVDTTVAEATAVLVTEEAKKADAAAHNSASGATVPGSAAGKSVKTAAAK